MTKRDARQCQRTELVAHEESRGTRARVDQVNASGVGSASRSTLIALLLFILSLNSTYGQGLITTIAGTGYSFPSRPIPTSVAPIGGISGTALDRTGNLYICDTDNNYTCVPVLQYFNAVACTTFETK